MARMSLREYCNTHNMQWLLDEWDYEANDISPDEVTSGSARKVHWKCSLDHTWEANIANRVRGSKCPYCSHRKVLTGYNDLAHERPDLLTDWDYKKNEVNPAKIMPSSNTKVWWRCHVCGHSWEATPNNRSTRNTGCPECAKRHRKAHTTLCEERPDLLADWDDAKNDPAWLNLSVTSKTQVHWKCHICGNEWSTALYQRALQNTGCPACKGVEGMSPWLADRHPELAQEWDYEANGSLTPETVTCGADTQYGWICPRGHHYKASIGNRTRNKSGCPYCSGKLLLQGFNDIATLYPDIAAEWDRDKNGDGPEDHLAHSGETAWWRCRNCGGSWQATIANRTGRNKTGCPHCGSDQKVSLIETALAFYCKRVFPDTIRSYRPDWLEGRELDIVIPSLRFAIEYDGVLFHSDSERDAWKSERCRESGFDLLHVREPGCPLLPDVCSVVQLETVGRDAVGPALAGIASFVSARYGIKVDFERDEESDRPAILALWATSQKENSLSNRFPDLVAEWDVEKNAGLTPDRIAAFSNQKVWWRCSICGHEWLSTVNNRTANGQGCPICARRKQGKTLRSNLIAKRGSLAKRFPQLAAEWDYEQNDSTPDQFTAGSSEKVWWICPVCGNRWKTAINHRTSIKPTGCPRCGHKYKRPNRQ